MVAGKYGSNCQMEQKGVPTRHNGIKTALDGGHTDL